MKKIITLLFTISYFGLSNAQAPGIQWQKAFGGSTDDFLLCITQTADGGYVMAGYTRSSDGDVTTNHGAYDFWVVKLTATGIKQWQKTFGGTGDELAYSIQQTTEGGYIVAGHTYSIDGDVTGNHGQSDCWILKLTSTGMIQWKKTLGGTKADLAFSIQQTADDGYIVAGNSTSNNGDITINNGNDDYWIIKLSKTGAIEWQKALGGTGNERATSIQQTTDGGYIVAGNTSSNNGDVTGNHGDTDCWIVKLTATGTIEWQKNLGGSRSDYTWNIHQTKDAGYIMAAYTTSNDGDISGNHGNTDCWIVKLSATGTIQWQKAIGGTEDDQAQNIQQTTDGGYILVGYTASYDGDVSGNHGDYDYWIVKLTSAGSIQWQKTLGGTSTEQAFSIVQTADGGFIISGETYSTDGDFSGNHGGPDCWIVKLAADNLGAEDYTLKSENLLLYPNPACDTFQISNNENLKSIDISDTTGKTIQTISNLDSNQTTVDVSHLPTGVYMVETISESNLKSTKKLIIQ